MLIFLLIYWVLPNRRLPIVAVLPAAITTGLLWEVAKRIYIALLPWLDFRSVYGPFSVSVSLMMWAFVSGLLMLAGAHYSASRHTLRLAAKLVSSATAIRNPISKIADDKSGAARVDYESRRERPKGANPVSAPQAPVPGRQVRALHSP